MAMTIHLDIVSAEKEIFSGLVEILVVSGVLGELGIQHGHTPLFTALKPGQVRLTLPDGKEEIYYISGGMLEVQPDCATVLADTVARADTLDEAIAVAAKEKAEAALAHHEADFDYSKAATELARAIAQIQTIRQLRERKK
ncbi:MAG: F0F1 ATP synthase subunit epsilon [Gammaproteobacteria bacterium]